MIRPVCVNSSVELNGNSHILKISARTGLFCSASGHAQGPKEPLKLLWHILQESLRPGQDLFCLIIFAN